MNNFAEKKAAVEAVLFTMGDTVELSALAAAAETDEETAEQILLTLRGEYELRGSGLQIVRIDDGWQMCTKKEVYPALIRVASRPKKYHFSDSTMETLSIIAYRQPVTRLEMERIRGVSCAHAVDRLLEFGVIEEVGRLNAPGRPVLFGTTKEFLRVFGLSSLEDLPVVDEKEYELFHEQAEEEAGPPVEVGV